MTVLFQILFYLLLFIIKPAIKHPTVVIPAKSGHAVKLQRYPGGYWMPDQVRHD
jgi:hypothetical protein